MTAYQSILVSDQVVEEHAVIRIVSLCRPERRNALTQAMIAELTDVCLQAASNRLLRVLILTGEGDAFCSGLDLSELQKMAAQTADEQRVDSERIAAMFRALHDCPIPTIAAVQGAAVAGGMGLATICDFTLASPDARFGYPEVKIGFIPAIVSVFLKRQVGDKQARDLLLSGKLIDAEEARQLGLVTTIVRDKPVQAAAVELATSLVRNSPESLRATKSLLLQLESPQLDEDMEVAANANAAMRQTSDFAEGLVAFLEKRKPRWNKIAN